MTSMLAMLVVGLAACFAGDPALAKMKTRLTMQTPDGPPPSGGAGTFAAGPALDAAVTNRATGIFLISTFQKPGGGTYRTYGLLKQGELQEVHTKGAAWLQKRPGARSIKALSSSKFDQLIAAAGGADRNVEGNAALKASFYQIAGFAGGSGGTSGGGSGTGGGGSSPAPVPPCPADWATMTQAQRNFIENKPALRQQYLGCLSFDLRAPTHQDSRLAAMIASDALCTYEYELVFFSITWDNVFRTWGFTWSPQEAMMSFNGFGVTAIWSMTPAGGAGG
jgi:hypothetical protein